MPTDCVISCSVPHWISAGARYGFLLGGMGGDWGSSLVLPVIHISKFHWRCQYPQFRKTRSTLPASAPDQARGNEKGCRKSGRHAIFWSSARTLRPPGGGKEVANWGSHRVKKTASIVQYYFWCATGIPMQSSPRRDHHQSPPFLAVAVALLAIAMAAYAIVRWDGI